jgi:nicotinamidase-related amidase
MGRKHPPQLSHSVQARPDACFALDVSAIADRGRAMVGRRITRVYECVVVDLNTQRDLCQSDGAFPVANLEDLIPALRRMIAWTKRNGAPVISSIDSHRDCELPESGQPVHCVDGSRGQRKVDYTILPSRIRVEVDNTLAVPLDLFTHCQQVIFRQRGDDLLENPKADRFLTQLPTQEFIIFGNTLEGPIKASALGLVARDKAVTVVADACGYWDRSAADLALRQMSAKGARLITLDELLARKLVRRYRYRFAVAPGDSGVHGEGCIYLGVDRNGKRSGNGPRNNGRVRPRNRRRR